MSHHSGESTISDNSSRQKAASSGAEESFRNSVFSSQEANEGGKNSSSQATKQETPALCVQHFHSEPSVYEGKVVGGHIIQSRVHLQSEKNPDSDNWVAFRNVSDDTARGITGFDIKLTDGKLDPATKNTYFDFVDRKTGKDELCSSDNTNYPRRQVKENSEEYNKVMKAFRSLDFDRLPDCEILGDSEEK